MFYEISKADAAKKRSYVNLRFDLIKSEYLVGGMVIEYYAADLCDDDMTNVLLRTITKEAETHRIIAVDHTILNDFIIAQDTTGHCFLVNSTHYTEEEMEEYQRVAFSSYDNEGVLRRATRLEHLEGEPERPMDGADEPISITVDDDGNREIRITPEPQPIVEEDDEEEIITRFNEDPLEYIREEEAIEDMIHEDIEEESRRDEELADEMVREEIEEDLSHGEPVDEISIESDDMAIAAKVEEELTRMRFDRRPEPQPEPQPEVKTLDDMMVEEEAAIQHIKEQPRKKNVIKADNIRFEKPKKQIEDIGPGAEPDNKVNKIRFNNQQQNPKPKKEKRKEQHIQQSNGGGLFRTGNERNPVMDDAANDEMGDIFNTILRKR